MASVSAPPQTIYRPDGLMAPVTTTTTTTAPAGRTRLAGLGLGLG